MKPDGTSLYPSFYGQGGLGMNSNGNSLPGAKTYLDVASAYAGLSLDQQMLFRVWFQKSVPSLPDSVLANYTMSAPSAAPSNSVQAAVHAAAAGLAATNNPTATAMPQNAQTSEAAEMAVNKARLAAAAGGKY